MRERADARPDPAEEVGLPGHGHVRFILNNDAFILQIMDFELNNEAF